MYSSSSSSFPLLCLITSRVSIDKPPASLLPPDTPAHSRHSIPILIPGLHGSWGRCAFSVSSGCHASPHTTVPTHAHLSLIKCLRVRVHLVNENHFFFVCCNALIGGCISRLRRFTRNSRHKTLNIDHFSLFFHICFFFLCTH